MTTADVRAVPLFQHLSPAQQRRLTARATVHHCRRGQMVFHQGQPATAMWIVLEGWVHLVRFPKDHGHGQGAVIATVTPREALCGISAMEATTYAASGIVASEARLLEIPAADFNAALAQAPAFATAVLCACNRRIRQMTEQHGAMLEPVPRRIVRALLQLRAQFGDTLPMTHRELAQMSWTTTESAIRAVGALKRKGYVSGRRGQLTIRRAEALAHLLDGRAVVKV